MKFKIDPAPAAVVDRNGLEILDRAECLRLLGTATLGRIGLCINRVPTVLPVNFAFDGERIFLRTSDGTKLEAAGANSLVAFEVDDFDSMYHAGWSVLVVGMMSDVTDSEKLDELLHLRLTRWAPMRMSHLVAITLDTVSGRRIPIGAPRPGA